MDDPKKNSTVQTTASSPITGSTVSRTDLKHLTGKLRSSSQKEINKLLTKHIGVDPQAWSLDELAADMRVMYLENLIDNSLDTVDASSDQNANDFDEGSLDMHFEVIGDINQDSPPEITNFLRSLNVLVRRTQAQLRKFNKK